MPGIDSNETGIPPVSTLFNRTLFGLIGMPLTMDRQPIYEDNEDGINTAYLPGKYTVIFTLSRPGEQLLTENQILEGNMITGNSHISFHKPESAELPSEIEFKVEVDEKVYHVKEYLNVKGHLASIHVLSFNAENQIDAEQIAQRLILPSISYYSTTCDTPIFIYQTDIIELRTDARRLRIVNQFITVNPTTKGLEVIDTNKEINIFTALYREALNSNSFIYQFLCFYKIIEGLRSRRKKRKSELARSGAIFSEPSERLPGDRDKLIKFIKDIYPNAYYDWDNFNFDTFFPRQFYGRKINDVVDNELRRVRDAISHAILDEEDLTLYVDESAHIEKIHKLLPITKSISRFLLKQEFPSHFQ